MKKNFVFVVLFAMVLAFCVGCASTADAFVGAGELVYEDSCEVGGHKVTYSCYDDRLTVEYGDAIADADVERFASDVANLYSVVHSYEKTADGQITFYFTAMPVQSIFDAIIENLNGKFTDSLS